VTAAAILNDEALHAALCAALDARRVELVADPAALSHTRSPLFSEWDNLAPLLGLMPASLVVLLFGGLAWGIAAMAGSALVLLFGLRHWAAHRIRQRADMAVRSAPDLLDRLWRHGGMALVPRGNGVESCLAPDGDWRGFVRQHLAEGK